MSARASQSKHDLMVERIFHMLLQRGYKSVRADLPGHEKPVAIKWQNSEEKSYPDVTGFKDDVYKIFEIETADSIFDEHTDAQWRLFASFAKDNDAMFYIVFPKGAIDDVKKRLEELAIEANLMEI